MKSHLLEAKIITGQAEGQIDLTSRISIISSDLIYLSVHKTKDSCEGELYYIHRESSTWSVSNGYWTTSVIAMFFS